MALFDDISKKISDVGQNTLQKTKGLTEIAKYSSAISDEEKRIKMAYTTLGELYYEKKASEPDSDFTEIVGQITEIKGSIEELRCKIEALKNQGKCPNCGGIVSENDAFCPTCGSKIEKRSETEAVSSIRKCPNCGNVLSDGAAFCIFCGNKIENDNATNENELEESENSITTSVKENGNADETIK